MDSILLLLKEDQESIIEWIGTRHKVLYNQGIELPTSFDLCVVDEASLAEFKSQLEILQRMEQPALLPVLLVVSRERLRDISPEYWDSISELIAKPLERIEFEIRLNSLLKARELSIVYKRRQTERGEMLETIESSQEARSISNMNGSVLYHNYAFANLYGFSIDEINEEGFANTLFLQPDVAQETLTSLQQGMPWHGAVWLRHKDGTLIPTLLHLDPIENESGEGIGMMGAYTDLSNHKHIQTIEREQRILAEALIDISTALTTTLDLSEVLERILANIGKVVPHDMANIMLIEDGSVRLVGSRGYETRPDIDDGTLLFRSVNALRWMAETGRSLIVSDTQTYPRWSDALQATGLFSYAGSPIQLGGKVIGFLNLGSRTPGFFKPIHAQRLQAFAEQAGIAIQNAQLHEKARRLAAIQERQRLARDLHDAVSQTLFSASVIAEALPRLWERSPDKVWPRLQQLHTLARGALAEMRNLLLELRPEALMDINFDDLLHQLVEGVVGRSHVDVSLHINMEEALPPEYHEALYYITVEALNNIVKHAHARQAAIKFTSNAEGGTLRIDDDGDGFDLQQTSPTSLGLDIMQERAERIEADLEIKSAEGEGTQVVVKWAYENGERK